MNGTIGLRWILLPFLCVVLASTACAPKKTVKKGAGTGTDAAQAGASTDEVPGGLSNIETSEARITDGGTFVANKELEDIRFDYDAYGLDDAARAILKKNAEYLKANPDMESLVAGHCDERGTTGYNLALGQKRAKEVREYYIRLGVRAKSLATISYGEEQGVCREATEDCWSRNRRAETRIRTRTVSNGGHGLDPKSPQ